MSALQSYLRTFEGLPEPILVAAGGDASPLALTCYTLVTITDEFLASAQQHGTARRSVDAKELFLCLLGIAWVSDLGEEGGVSPRALSNILLNGCLSPERKAALP